MKRKQLLVKVNIRMQKTESRMQLYFWILTPVS